MKLHNFYLSLLLLQKKNLLLMKKTYFFSWILFLTLLFQFTSCDDEPLEGEFQQEEEVTVEEGQFKANVEGNNFVTNSVTAVLTTSDNVLTITALKADTGEAIILTVENPLQDTFNITLGNPSLVNSGSYLDGVDNNNPYISAFALGGSGQLQLTEFDTVTNKVSGTFSFVAARFLLDDNGFPVIDGSGNPVLETRTVTVGEFNKIAFTIDDSNDDGGGNNNNPNNVFFAKVDDVDFIADTIEATQVPVSEVNMINVIAHNTEGQTLRLDFPQDLGVGTFPMEALSDGTKIIGLYNANNGGENLTSSPGTLTITEYNTTEGIIKGTFEFTGSDPLNIDPTIVQVTEGNFELYGLDLSVEVNSTFSADINSLAFSPDEVLVSQDTFNGINRVSITAKDTNTNQELGLLFPKDITVGTYSMEALLITGDEKIGIYTPDSNNSITFKSALGTLIISAYDIETGVIEGTFEFEASDPTGNDPDVHQITNGIFMVEIQ